MKQKTKVGQNQERTALANGYSNEELDRTAITRNSSNIIFYNIVDKIRA